MAASRSTATPAKPNVAPTMEVGKTGLKFSAGRVLEEFLKDLIGARGAKVYREMTDNDSTVGSIIFAIDKLIRGVQWRVEPGKDMDPEADEVVFVQECMNDMDVPWADMISEALSMLSYGWSFHEMTFKKRNGKQPDTNPETAQPDSKFDDGKIGWHKLGGRSQDTLVKWELTSNGTILGMWQSAPPSFEQIFIPIQKALLFRTTAARNNPEGRSVLRNAYRAWYFKKRIEEIEAIGIERDLAGFPVMYVDPQIMATSASDGDKQAYEDYKDIIRNIRRDAQEGLILPSIYDAAGNQLYKLELVSSGGARSYDTNGIIQRYDQRIAMTVLADFVLLGTNSVGSFALSSDKTSLFATALRTWLEIIKEQLNNKALPLLFKLNGMDTTNMPVITYGDIEDISLTELGAFLTSLKNAGILWGPDEQLEEYLRDRARLPKRPEELEPLENPANPFPVPGQQDPNADPNATNNDETGAEDTTEPAAGE